MTVIDLGRKNASKRGDDWGCGNKVVLEGIVKKWTLLKNGADSGGGSRSRGRDEKVGKFESVKITEAGRAR